MSGGCGAEFYDSVDPRECGLWPDLVSWCPVRPKCSRGLQLSGRDGCSLPSCLLSAGAVINGQSPSKTTKWQTSEINHSKDFWYIDILRKRIIYCYLLLSLTVPNLYTKLHHRCVCIHRKKHSMYRFWFSQQFQASSGGLGKYPRGIGGTAIDQICL